MGNFSLGSNENCCQIYIIETENGLNFKEVIKKVMIWLITSTLKRNKKTKQAAAYLGLTLRHFRYLLDKLLIKKKV